MTNSNGPAAIDAAADGHPGRGGLSRRQMIRAAAATGAAAWTAPVILDSLTSPAAAESCIKYYAKLDPSGGCVAHDPSCNYDVAKGSKYVCCSSDTSGEDCPYPAKLPSLSSTSPDNANYYTVTLKDGCTFGPVPDVFTATNWQVVGNYNFTTPCPRLTGTVGATQPGSGYVGDGYFQVGGRKAWIRKDHKFGTTTINLSYIYLQFCCGT
jgi:hypothetical protein